MQNRLPYVVILIVLAIATAGTQSLSAPTKRVAAPAKSAPVQSRPAEKELNPAFAAYLGRLRAKINTNWLLPDGRNEVVLTATVQPDGSVTDLDKRSTPKNDQAEDASFDAFNKSQPLEPLPAGLQSAKITLTFQSYADPHGDCNSNLLTKFDPVYEAKTQSDPAPQQPSQ